MIDGVATGAGLALALACDWRVGTERARILYREGQLGLIATHGGCARLVKLVGLARARELMLGGDDLDAEAARASGLLSELPPGTAGRRRRLGPRGCCGGFRSPMALPARPSDRR